MHRSALLLTLSDPAGHKIGARDTVEGGLDLRGDGLGQAGLSRTGGSVQQDPLPGLYTPCNRLTESGNMRERERGIFSL